MFEINRFMLYMEQNYDLNDYAQELLLGVIGSGLQFHNNRKDQFAFFLADIIPDLNVKVVAHFCSEDMLNNELYNSSRTL